MKSRKITSTNHNDGIGSSDDVIIVRGGFYNQLKDDWDAHVPSDGSAKFNTIAEYTAGQGVTIDGVLIKDGIVTTTGPVIKSVAPAVTAFATGGKPSATPLTEEINVITTCATALDSVLLPAAVVGLKITIANLGAATCAVYAAGTNTIDDVATANPVVLQVEDVVTFYCYTTAKWQSDFESDGSYGTVYVDTIAENTAANGVAIDGVLLKDNAISLVTGGVSMTPNAVQYVTEVTLTAGQIVGTATGDLGHTAGAPLVAAQGAGSVVQFVQGLLVYDFDTTGYTGAGSNDLVVRQGTTAVSSVILDADLLLATEDKIVSINNLAAGDIALTANTALNLKSSAVVTATGAAGVIRAFITYNVITTGL